MPHKGIALQLAHADIAEGGNELFGEKVTISKGDGIAKKFEPEGKFGFGYNDETAWETVRNLQKNKLYILRVCRGDMTSCLL